MYNDHLRQTGRTSRMLKQAIESALDGCNVFVISHTNMMAQCAAKMVEEVYKRDVMRDYRCSESLQKNKQGEPEYFMHQRGAGTIRFISMNAKDICLEAYPYCRRGYKEKCFVDHVVWEEAGWRPSHQKRNEPSHPWNPAGYKRLWEALFPGSPFGVISSSQTSALEVSKSVANKMAKKPYMSSADGDMRDKFGGGPI